MNLVMGFSIQNTFPFCLSCTLARWVGSYFEGWQSAPSLGKQASPPRKNEKICGPSSEYGEYMNFSNKPTLEKNNSGTAIYWCCSIGEVVVDCISFSPLLLWVRQHFPELCWWLMSVKYLLWTWQFSCALNACISHVLCPLLHCSCLFLYWLPFLSRKK